MSSPLLWIFLPALTGIVLFFFRRSGRVPAFVGAGIALLLAWAAWQLPLEQPLTIGPLSIRIAETLTLLGRAFTLPEAMRPFLAFFYLIAALWLLGAAFTEPGALFVPLALEVVALLTASLAVNPFLYAALFIEVAVLLLVPLLAPAGRQPSDGVFRFLAFQTLGMPFILFVGWLLAGVEASPGNLELVVRAALLLALGFLFLVAAFPFHSWIPMLAADVHPYVAGFLFLMLPWVVSVFGVGFLDQYTWLRGTEGVYLLLRILGAFMVGYGGIASAFQNHLGRIFGYAALMETGYALLAIGLSNSAGLALFFALMAPRAFAMLIWAASLAWLAQRTERGLNFTVTQGIGIKYLHVSVALLLAQFALGGLPLFAAFPVRLALWEQLAPQSLGLALLTWLGALGLLAAGLRTLTVFVGVPTQPQEAAFDSARSRLGWVYLGLSGGLLVIMGLFPQWFLPALSRMPAMFPQLVP